MSKELALIQTIEALVDYKDTWDTLPVVQRRDIIKEFHKRVDELAVNSPYDTDSGMGHFFGDGTYGREAKVKAGVALVGRAYHKPQINVLIRGVVFVATENKLGVMEAPCVFVSDAGTNKIGYVIEDMQWITVMSRDNTCIDPEAILDTHTVKPEGGNE